MSQTRFSAYWIVENKNHDFMKFEIAWIKNIISNLNQQTLGSYLKIVELFLSHWNERNRHFSRHIVYSFMQIN